MTKENQLKILEVILEKRGINNHYVDFHDSYIKQLNISYADFEAYLSKLINENYLDKEYWSLTPSFHTMYENLKREIQEEKHLQSSEIAHKQKEQRLTALQVRFFWPSVAIAVIGCAIAIYSAFNPGFDKSEYIKKSDLDKILKEYTKKEKHEGDLMGLHDLIYSDTTLVNKK